MKLTIEKVERLMESADVGYETAKEALEAADGDLLEAAVALERDGKLGPNAKSGAAYSTDGRGPGTDASAADTGSAGVGAGRSGGTQGSAYEYSQDPAKGYPQPQYHAYKDESASFEEGAKRFFQWIWRAILAGCRNFFEVRRRGVRVFGFPVILFLFCLIPWVFWIVVILLIVGLFCGCRYGFSGPHLGRKGVNDTMGKASDIADDIKDAARNKAGE